MKYLLKKYKFLLIIVGIINIAILVIGVVRTNYSLTLKGDTSKVDSVIEIDTDYVEEGSISSIFVRSVNKPTLLMNLYADLSGTSEKSELSESYSNFTDAELTKAGTIQYQSALDLSIINAFLMAMKEDSSITIEYSLKGIGITFYTTDSPFKIGDLIVGINDILASEDLSEFATQFNSRKSGDYINILRDGVYEKITLDDDSKYSFYGYKLYNINYETICPKVTINYGNVLGPSGGLLQTLSNFNRLTKTDYTHGKKIAGTGTIDIDGSVGVIGGIKEKIYTAFDDNIDIFFCPADNYEEALEAYNTLNNKERMQLVKVETFSDAIEYLKNVE